MNGRMNEPMRSSTLITLELGLLGVIALAAVRAAFMVGEISKTVDLLVVAQQKQDARLEVLEGRIYAVWPKAPGQ